MVSLQAKRGRVAAALSMSVLAACMAASAFAQEINALAPIVDEEDITSPSLFPSASSSRPTLTQRREAAAQLAGEEEEAAISALIRTRPLTFDEGATSRQLPDNERVTAIENRASMAQANPFAPLGIRAGTFVLRPRLEQGIGWTSNATGAPDGRASTFSETRLRLDAQSDWSRHAAIFATDLNWRKSVSGEEIDEVEGGVTGRLDLDLANELSVFAAGAYRVVPESASTPGTIIASISRPLRHTIDASVGLSREVGLLRPGLTASITREAFGNAELANGTIASQRERNSTLAMTTLRVGYAASALLIPFVEVETGRRFYDQKHDSMGYARSADHYALRGGVTVDFGEKLAGEFALGWLGERPDDARLDPISGLSVTGNLSWSPQRGTNVALAAATSVETATAPGITGSLLYSTRLSLQRELRANLTGEAIAGIDWRDYSGNGHDLILRGEASLTWWMNRYAGITARARHEKQQSNLAGRDYDATSIWLGMSFQR